MRNSVRGGSPRVRSTYFRAESMSRRPPGLPASLGLFLFPASPRARTGGIVQNISSSYFSGHRYISSKARAFCALSIVSVSFLYPVLDGLLGRLKLLGEARGCSSVSGEFDDSVSEFIGVWWTGFWHGLSRSVSKVKECPPYRVRSSIMALAGAPTWALITAAFGFSFLIWNYLEAQK